MQPANNVELRRSFANALLGTLIDFLERKSVSARRTRVTAKGAQLAVRYANVRGIDVAVDVEVSDVAMALLANVIRQPPNCQQIRRSVECDAVISGDALSGKHLVRN